MTKDERELTISLIKLVADFVAKKEATLVVVSGYHLAWVDNHSETEKWLQTVNFNEHGVGGRVRWLRNKPQHFDALYADLPQYSDEYIDNVFSPIPSINSKRGQVNVDMTSKYVNISNGFRHTVGQPSAYDNSIFMIGASSAFGYGCEDKHTLSSSIQRLINDATNLSKKYSVFNLGAMGTPKFGQFHKLLNLNVQPNDVVILQGIGINIVRELSHLSSNNLHFVSIDLSERKGLGEIFFDPEHVTYKGHKLVARQIFDRLFSTVDIITEDERSRALATLHEHTACFRDIKGKFETLPEFQRFIGELKAVGKKQGTVGATVVNCNPFTLGHRHLIEYASSKVDHLYVFVVEENLSYFDFNDRLAMVIEGTKDIANVTVLRTGKYMMSTVTYPGYFSKDAAQTAELDATTDMDTFGEFIAPALNISVRFIGEEPRCNVTRQHNNQMRTILPTYGVRVEEIDRIRFNDEIISASLVRRYIENSEAHRIKGLVPESTYSYIEKRLPNLVANAARRLSA